MLTIDDIVAKHRTALRDNIENSLRYLPPAERTKQIATIWQRQASPFDEAKEAELRKSLLADSREKQITRYLILFGNQGERAYELWEATRHEPIDVFWRVVLDWWRMCENNSQGGLRDLFLRTFRQPTKEQPATDYLSDADKAFLAGLPDPVPVFRGCGKRYVRSLSWTTDKKKRFGSPAVSSGGAKCSSPKQRLERRTFSFR
jgi:hypothetical protein